MYRLRPLIMILVGSLLYTSARSQEVTNAFLDLERKGIIEENRFNNFKSATAKQVQELTSKLPSQGYFCFTENRENDLHSSTLVPLTWVEREEKERTIFKGVCRPNEFYTYQIALYTPIKELKELSIHFTDLKNEKGDKIASSAINCFNLGGIDIYGKAFKKQVDVEKGKIQPFWIGISTAPQHRGTYRGKAIVKPRGEQEMEVEVAIRVDGEVIASKGDQEAERKSRLRWLNYTDDKSLPEITAPYRELKVQNSTIKYLGGELALTPMGIPAQITTHYNSSNQLDYSIKNNILASAMKFIIETNQGIEHLKEGRIRITNQQGARGSWESISRNANFKVTVRGYFDYDGFSNYQIEVQSLREQTVKDIRLEVSYTETASTYLMGLGKEGGRRVQETYRWKWDTSKHQDKIWIGGVNCGMSLRFKDESFRRPLVNIYYDLGKLKEPASWGNEKRGGIDVIDQEEGCQLKAYSAARSMIKGETLRFDFEILITPVKPLDLQAQATDRIYHSNSDLSQNYIEEAKQSGANYITVHHKKDIYPYINYPYHDSSVGALNDFIKKAHQEKIKVRAYYTTRELTVKIPELWAFRSLGGEVIHDGPGEDTRTLIHSKGPHKWLCENLKTNFIPAWYNAFNEGPYKGEMDLSVITTPDSRWNNYYLAGLDWMVKNISLDGIYIDDSALDRHTLKRARRILDEDGKKRLIDIHSWNHFNKYAGYANSLHIYMDLLPYVDKIWMGEGFGDYHNPDFWLVEMSGIPFGVMSEMLDAQNRYRGMIYGMLPRMPWSGNPQELWKLWDDFSMADATLKGFWDASNPITLSNEKLKATTYLKEDKALIVIANWSSEPERMQLQINSNLLGFEPTQASLPEIRKIQWGEESFNWNSSLSIPSQSGLIILLER